MTESQRNTIQECIEATRLHYDAFTTGKGIDSDDIMDGLAVTESKLKMLLRDDVVSRASAHGGSALARILREIRRKANYETAGFSSFKIPGKVDMDFPFKLPFTSDELTGAIKEATRLYRDSWINPLIDALIEWTEGKKDIRQIERDLL